MIVSNLEFNINFSLIDHLRSFKHADHHFNKDFLSQIVFHLQNSINFNNLALSSYEELLIFHFYLSFITNFD